MVLIYVDRVIWLIEDLIGVCDFENGYEIIDDECLV
jgi:hypothetical protein